MNFPYVYIEKKNQFNNSKSNEDQTIYKSYHEIAII